MRFSRYTEKPKNGGEPETECPVEPELAMPIQLDEIVEEFMVRTRRLLVVGEINEIASTHICSYLQLFSLRKEPVYMYINSQVDVSPLGMPSSIKCWHVGVLSTRLFAARVIRWPQ